MAEISKRSRSGNRDAVVFVQLALAAVVEQAADVRVRERCDGARLAVEAHGVGPGAEQLDRNLSVELQVVGQPDLGHSSRSERFLEPVAARDRLPHDAE